MAVRATAPSNGAGRRGYEVFEQQRQGIRYAYLDVLPHVSGDIILTLNPDGNCAPEFMRAIIAKVREGYDLVIGSRYLGNAHSDEDDMITRLGIGCSLAPSIYFTMAITPMRSSSTGPFAANC